MASLSAGKHTISIVSDGGVAETTFIVQAEVADTSDKADLMLWGAVMLVSIGTLAVLGRKKRNCE